MPARVLILASLLTVAAVVERPAAGHEPDATAGRETVEAFAASMTDVALLGRFNTRLPDGTVRESRRDRYRIASVERFGTKPGDDRYVINASIAYRRASGQDIDLTVPVVVRLRSIDDSVLLTVDDLSIPGLGSEFGAKLLFDGDQYAGTWRHGEVGGAMWGTIETTPTDDASEPGDDADPSPETDETPTQ